MPKAVIGNQIIVYSVNPPKSDTQKIKILRRPNYLVFSWKTKDRKGNPCEAFINEKITEKTNLQCNILSFEKFIKYLKKTFIEKIGCDFEIFHENNSLIKCKKLHGECHKCKTQPVKTQGFHGKNQTIIEGSNPYCALCYEEISYVEEEKYAISV